MERHSLWDGWSIPRLIQLSYRSARVLEESHSSKTTWMITGGLGGLGLLTACEIATISNAAVAVVSRSGILPPGQTQVLDSYAGWLEGACAFTRITSDVADGMALADAFSWCEPAVQCGVVHAAGAVRDALLQNESMHKTREVLASKSHAASQLHRLSQSSNVVSYITFSSASAVFGNIGQCSYTAASAYIDGAAGWAQSQKFARVQ
eukprot:gnl/MRDRNA2_/MRDRNA2_86212_c0_seq1.p1 gnl/MRDRNA2_/MRDRNA2_86212_c0~~gnl/MRDRNA2_/MRDRNA2_86212_c0_seq1.p1  ORF type:complete len:207 (+),score=13.29 gnl/MRDRNA2_/MRDRNA2_86212_c0_seq1:214-834(+)